MIMMIVVLGRDIGSVYSSGGRNTRYTYHYVYHGTSTDLSNDMGRRCIDVQLQHQQAVEVDLFNNKQERVERAWDCRRS